MKKVIPQETRDEIVRLYNEGTSYTEIARRTGVSTSSVYGFTKLRERFESLSAYREHLVKRAGFKSLNDYQKHLAEKHGFESRNDYEENLVIERGFESRTAYEKQMAKEIREREGKKELRDLVESN